MPVVDEAVRAIAALPIIGTATEISLPGDGNYSSWLASSRQGFYAYDWNLWHGPIREAAELVNLSLEFAYERAITIQYSEAR